MAQRVRTRLDERRNASSATWMEKWAFRGTFAENRANLPDTRLSTGAVLAVVGLCLVLLGVALDA